jgi:hypothetical protein
MYFIECTIPMDIGTEITLLRKDMNLDQELAMRNIVPDAVIHLLVESGL